MREWRLFVLADGQTTNRRFQLARAFPHPAGRKGLLRVDRVDASRSARLDELLHAIDCWTKIDDPARGEA
jgi:hypothetical protein